MYPEHYTQILINIVFSLYKKPKTIYNHLYHEVSIRNQRSFGRIHLAYKGSDFVFLW